MKLKSLLHYGIVLEKYDKLVKIRKASKMWFREIRPSQGEDKKLSKYGIIGKICITGLREMPTTAHRMMTKVL